MQRAFVLCFILGTLRENISASVGRNVCNSRICHETANRLIQYMDPSVSPCHDFYSFACGTFIKNSVIANNQDSIGPSVTLMETVNEQLKTILDEPLKPGAPKFEHDLKKLYRLCMDQDKINARGIQPAVELLRKVGGWPVLEEKYDRNWNVWSLLETEIAVEQIVHSGGIFFQLGVGKDFLDNTKIRIHLDQPTLGLEPEFLLKGPTEPVVMAYYEFMVDTAVLFGAKKNYAAIKMVDCLFLEIEIAKIMTTQEERRDFSRFYENKYTVHQLNTMIPWLNWARALDGMMPESVHEFTDEIIVVEPDYLRKLGKLLNRYPKEVVANYMTWRAVESMVEVLSDDIGKLKFDFDIALWGVTEMKPRWEKCLLMVSTRLDLALASLYVKKFFDGNSKRRAMEMVQRIRQQMLPEIDDVAWMDQTTNLRLQELCEAEGQHHHQKRRLCGTTDQCC
uniref:Peptidase M13 N-terminal domain-containing protein n=1 Tax=Graphocephala atropunctata TaxID=36148 RepID=A0A1B6MRS1_9HEMI